GRPRPPRRGSHADRGPHVASEGALGRRRAGLPRRGGRAGPARPDRGLRRPPARARRRVYGRAAGDRRGRGGGRGGGRRARQGRLRRGAGRAWPAGCIRVTAPTAESAFRRLTPTEAILEAIAQEMRRDGRVFCLGQDIGPFGGAMQGAHGLYEEFGPRRIRETPISESAMVGTAIGAALFGRRPIVEVSFGEFLPAAMSQLINQAPNLHYMTGGAARVPVVIRTRVGDGPYGGHPQDYSVWFAYVPGLKVVMPGTPADAKGLMLAAIRDDNPVLYVEPMSLAHGPREDVPAGDYLVPIGKARVAREGADLTIVTIGSTVPVALRAAATLEQEGV